MGASITNLHEEYAEIRREQLDFMKNRIAALFEIYLKNMQTQDHATQQRLGEEIDDLRAYVGGICHRFDAAALTESDDTRDFGMEAEWVDIKTAAIMKDLQKGGRGARLFF